eukprot:769547-Ditylum_brightwellii.AAC.1
MTSCAVLELVQKYSGVEPSLFGRMYQKFRSSSALTTRHQNPSLTSNLAHLKGLDVTKLSDMVATRRFMHSPS